MVVRGWVRRGRGASAEAISGPTEGDGLDGDDPRSGNGKLRPGTIARTDAVRARPREVGLRRAVEARDELVAVASHELRTPLAALQLQIDNALRDLRADPANPSVVIHLEGARRQVGRLSCMVERLLDVSQIATGRLSLELERLDLAEVVRDVVERMRDPLARAGCAVSIEQHGAAVGLWDRLRLEQVVTNLLANASKYGAGKPIDVYIVALGGHATLSIVDRGIGVDEADQARIFERFERAVSSRDYGGLGLGLFVVGRILAALGGSIRIDSRPGEGATFIVELECIEPLAERPST